MLHSTRPAISISTGHLTRVRSLFWFNYWLGMNTIWSKVCGHLTTTPLCAPFPSTVVTKREAQSGTGCIQS